VSALRMTVGIRDRSGLHLGIPQSIERSNALP
jgi:hypothetical protein